MVPQMFYKAKNNMYFVVHFIIITLVIALIKNY